MYLGISDFYGILCYSSLLGGPSTTVFAETIAGFFHYAGDEWPTGAAFAVIMFLTALIITFLFYRLMKVLRKGDT